MQSRLVISILNVFLFGILTISTATAKVASDQAYFKQFQDVFTLIEKEYVQSDNIDKQKMIDAAINGMLSSLDPHSSYFADEELVEFLGQTKGEFGGIGVEVLCEQSGIKVMSPLDDLPAYKAGIKAGDYIVGVNGELVSSLGCNKSIKEMKGTPGTTVKLLLVKDSEPKPIEIELTREMVKISPIKANLEPGNIAYIRITTFNENTTVELKSQFTKLVKEADNNLKGIILDVRNNAGGLLDQAIAVADYFLPSGTIVSIRSRKGGDNIISAKKFTDKAPNIPMIVLINPGAASASEVVTGALQDHKRAIIVGTKSFGKGSVQTLLPVSSRSAVKLTTAKYYTPNGRSIQADGIEPDVLIEIPAKVEYNENSNNNWRFSESSLKNYLQNDQKKDSTQKQETEQAVSEMYRKDYQYARAYDLIKALILISAPSVK